jgi:2''-5'' RNA ligase
VRLFTAIDLPESLRERIRPLLDTHLSGAKCLPLEQIHLTLRFLGEVNPAKFEEIRNALRQIHSGPFRLALHGTGCFPNPARARVLWVGLETPPELFDLQNRIESCVQSLGFTPESKPFAPHITLARFKYRPSPQLAALLEAQRDFSSESWEPEAFHLYSSWLSPKGAIHKVEESYRLG